MSILGMILFGLVVGIIAKLLMPGRDPGGFIMTVVLGVAGSLLGGWLFNVMGFADGARYAGWIGSILGAVVLLLIYRAVVGRNRPHTTANL
jgi:uncharacterized membrane protein YeaQ/YmgE (transglycosylase-associated protein family)